MIWVSAEKPEKAAVHNERSLWRAQGPHLLGGRDAGRESRLCSEAELNSHGNQNM